MKNYLSLKQIILIPLLLGLHTQFFAAAQNFHDTSSSYLSDSLSSYLSDSSGSNNGETSLILAIKNKQFDKAKKIIKKNPNTLTQITKNGSTPLHCAAYNGHFAIARHIIKINPTTFTQIDNTGWTPLHHAAYYGYFDIVKYIIKKDPATLTQKNKAGKTPLLKAASGGHSIIVTQIIKIDLATLTQKDNKGFSALHWAAHQKHLDIVDLILQIAPSIDFRIKTLRGSNILKVTPADKKNELIDLLKSHLVRLHKANPDGHHIQCPICFEEAIECDSYEDIANSISRSHLLSCCLNVVCKHDFAIITALEKPCPLCRCSLK